MTTSSLFFYYILLNLFFFLHLIENNFLVSARELPGDHHVIDVKSLLPSSSCSMPDKSTSPSRLNVVHRYGLCSSRAHQDKPSQVELFRRDQARVDYLHRQAANANTNTNARLNPIGGTLFARVPVSIDNLVDYTVDIGLGTPPKSFTVTFDTGSDLTWTQCVPCVNCHTQKDPFYDPTKSSTFTDIPCINDYCFSLNQYGCSSTLTCLYQEEYEDNSLTNGSLVQDTLTFSSNIIHNFHFGCGHNNIGEFGQEDGLLGLGRGLVSIISQTAQFYNNVFSYCLPSESSAIGYLELGSSVHGVKYTPMLNNPNMPSFYFLKLIGITIGVTTLEFTPTGTMLDSGTTFTHLPPTAYYALRDIFRKEMSNYPTAPQYFNLDTCYDLTNNPKVKVPKIELIYDGEVTAHLDDSGILYVVSESQVCLAFAGNNDDTEIAIIGNVQQRTLNVVYDVGNLKIGFGSNGCK